MKPLSTRISVILWLIVLLTFAGCKKEVIEQVHQNKIVEDNEAPPYNGVSTLEIENYVNKLYIDLIGREPSDNELAADAVMLKANDLDEASRETIIDNLTGKYDYYTSYFESVSGRMLNGIDSAEMYEGLALYQALIQMAYQQGDTLLAFYLEYEYGKFLDLYTATSEYASGSIDINEFYKRFIFNAYYDEINMGSTNFVLSCFENIFFRFPTVAEETQGVAMVDGSSSQVFLQDGNSKTDFIDIVTQVAEFYQGLVIASYRSFLARDPTSYEMDLLMQDLEQTGDLQEMQKYILKSKEYAGF